MCEGGGSGGEEVCRGERVLFLRSPEGVGSGGMSTTEKTFPMEDEEVYGQQEE